MEPDMNLSSNLCSQYTPVLNTSGSTRIYDPLDLTRHDGVATRLVTVLSDLSPEGRIQCLIEPVVLPLTPISGTEHEKGGGPITCEQLRAHNEAHRLYAVNNLGASAKQLRYKALSYLWGSGENVSPIVVNGINTFVGYNLWCFLERVRQRGPWTGDYWWIDALSINQKDVDEKNYQVRRMGLIFSFAIETVTWLGATFEGMDLLLDLAVDFLGKIAGESLDYYGTESNRILEQSLGSLGWNMEDYYSAVNQLHSLEYWSRAWIQQELHLGSNHSVLTDTKCVSLEILAQAVSRGMAQLSSSYIVNATFFRLATGFCYHIYGELPSTCLSEILLGPLGCEIVKDKVYSRLSRIINGDKFEVDYEESDTALLLRVLLLCSMEEEDNIPDEFEMAYSMAETLQVEMNDLFDPFKVIGGAKMKTTELLYRCEAQSCNLKTSKYRGQKEGVFERLVVEEPELVIADDNEVDLNTSICTDCTSKIVTVCCPLCGVIFEPLANSNLTKWFCVSYKEPEYRGRIFRFHVLFPRTPDRVPEFTVHVIGTGKEAGVSVQYVPALTQDLELQFSLSTLMFASWLLYPQWRFYDEDWDRRPNQPAQERSARTCSHRQPQDIFQREVTPLPDTEAGCSELLERLAIRPDWYNAAEVPLKLVEHIQSGISCSAKS